MVLDGHPFLTRGAFGVPALVTFVGNHGVPGLALATGFDGLTLPADHMMMFTLATVKLAVTQTAIIHGAGATHIIRTVKSTTSTTTSPLTTMMRSIVGIEPPFTVQTIIGAIDKRRKGRATIKMIIGFE